MKTVFLGPHVRMPLREASSMRSYEMACSLGQENNPVWLAGKSAVWLMDGTRVQKIQRIFARNDKIGSALQAAWHGGHYLVYKHLSPEWCRAAVELLNQTQPETVIVSFLWAYPAFRNHLQGCRVLIDTHNYDPEWWRNFHSHTRNPLRRHLARNAEAYILQVLQELPATVELIHVSQRDCEFYRQHRPDLRHHVLPNGCSPPPAGGRGVDYGAPIKKLYFIGLLSSQMSRDALEYFARKFWPELRDFCDFWVMGSDPDRAVKKLCRQQGWKQAYNLTEEDVAQHLGSMHYLVLPFAYGAGTKLKLVDACCRGIPVLSTAAGATGYPTVPRSVFLSESAMEWRQHARSHVPLADEVEAARNFGHDYSWDNLVRRFRMEILG